jgi:hypothetical protein
MFSMNLAEMMVRLSFDLHEMQAGFLNQDEQIVRDSIVKMMMSLEEIYTEFSITDRQMQENLAQSQACCGGGCSCQPSSGNVHPGFSAYSSVKPQSPTPVTQPTKTDSDWIMVVSSNIAAIKYDDESETLSVRFKDGDEYEYFDVPSGLYDDFMSASSKGRFFHQNIKDNYFYNRLN